MSDKQFMIYKIIILSSLLLLTALSPFVPLSSDDDDDDLKEKGRAEVRAEAVKAGVAEYYIDEKNEKAFRFKIEKGK